MDKKTILEYYENNKKVKYFGLVGIVETHKGHYVRIKVVISKTDGRSHYEVTSVIPAWNIKGYHRLYYNDEE